VKNMNEKINTPFGPVSLPVALLGTVAVVWLGKKVLNVNSSNLILAGGAGFLLWKWYQQRNPGASPFEFVGKPTADVKVTGRVEQTMHGGRPGEERIGFGRKLWAEVILPSGQSDWIEVKKTGA
jgi:hypothetical protein